MFEKFCYEEIIVGKKVMVLNGEKISIYSIRFRLLDTNNCSKYETSMRECCGLFVSLTCYMLKS